MSNGQKKRWGYPVLVTCSLVMGLSLWLHYSVSDAADSFDVVARKMLEASQKAQKDFKTKNSHYAQHAIELRDALKNVHRGPYLMFLNPGCESSLIDAEISGAPPTTPYIGESLEGSQAHLPEIKNELGDYKSCPAATSGFTFVLAAFEKKKSQWDIWATSEAGNFKHVRSAKLPPTRAHRIKQIAIVLLVLGSLGLVSLWIPRFLDRFYIRREDTNVPTD